jgi:hypothetical protein
MNMHPRVNRHFERAMEHVLKKFGKKYAAAHPELIVGIMLTAAIDAATAALVRAILASRGIEVEGARERKH